jgi:hypothetical protein
MQVLTTAPMQCRSFDFLLETMAVLERSRCSVREVPITYRFTNSSLNHRIVIEALKTWWRLSRQRKGQSVGAAASKYGGIR